MVNDIDAAAAAAVAASCGAAAIAGDAASEDGVAALVSAARAELGEIDLYCANAGIARAGGPEAAEADWEASWQVNVMAHVRAARLLLGPWLERGSGHLICTVSAAGLLTIPGSAPYAVTKHGALALCRVAGGHLRAPRTSPCRQSARSGCGPRCLTAPTPRTEALLGEGAIQPEAVADAVMQGIADGRFLILPHPEVAGMYAGRAAETDRWLRGMSKVQQRLEELE